MEMVVNPGWVFFCITNHVKSAQLDVLLPQLIKNLEFLHQLNCVKLQIQFAKTGFSSLRARDPIRSPTFIKQLVLPLHV